MIGLSTCVLLPFEPLVNMMLPMLIVAVVTVSSSEPKLMAPSCSVSVTVLSTTTAWL